ncbi:MAG: CHASE domain-containing protein, partial [Bacteroidales bacterium]|nr:CHASE domain-containing protein [Bacteroidales bacterium]
MSTYKYRKLLSYITLAVLLTISVLTWQHYEKTAMEREERRYNEYVNSVVEDVTERLDKHKMILRGGAGLFSASEEVTREEWLAYYQYQQVSTLYPGIQGIAFSKVVQSPELEQHIEEIRAEDFSDYMIWPEGEHDLYVPVVFIEPFDEQNQYYLGYDLFSEAVLRTVMERAQNTGEASMSDMVSLMDETGEGTQPGFLMFVPVYAQGMPLNSPEERRETLEGYVFGTYFMDELMQGIFPDPMHHIDFHIYDGSEASPEALMYYSHVSLDAPGNERRPLFTSQKNLDMFGHQWTIVLETTPVFEAAVDQYTPKGILAAG